MRPETLKFALIASLVVFFISFEPNEGCRLLDGEFEETWMKTGNLLLSSSLQRGPVRPPGNGCGNTNNGGNPCRSSTVGSKNFAGVAAPPPPTLPTTPSLTHAYPQQMVGYGVAS
ncbi:hypothetical protein OSB04_023256 [Centaurea solstitialis]|uniref:Uncharacterized protein n=1 Tax=Centaurea solstitialis TaxID=347529 RepID=A0AA38SKH0_9ASTR|nr:hypothetical protein OSB04_023256 [Centaurea solstitialis]